MYDLILQNNGDKRMFILSGLTDISDTHLYLDFEDVTMPEGAEDGEYSYACIHNDRNDVEYELKTDLLDSIVKADGVEVQLRDLRPIVGLLRVGLPGNKNIYIEKNKNYYYKK